MTQALYRRYRPVTFAEVIGQEHVTTPLKNALDGKRTHHAYLFSGPRGCGKTSSARILARCVNCQKGPTSEPCGVCQSCQDLGPGGAGSLDVIEIDAASHGGVDDARDLRERAFYAPASSRYKIYIIDEAHMVSREGFNALLKLVEEPPEHVMFVFATTEPEKVIATIRSRTHHYPFRLVPPGELHAHLARVCEQEKVAVDPTVLSLVVRAGRGSVRDSLSVLDQLLAGSGPEGLTYAGAAALLGYTDASLLDDTVEAFAAGDGAAVFTIVDRVVEAGHDPRRFAEDLLERLRDLVIIDAVPDAAASILGEHPTDELERMRQQAAHFGAAALSRAADVVNAGLTEMRGATAPRLQLELMCARVLLPAADDADRGLAARLDRLERRASITSAPARAGTAAPGRAGTPAAAPAAAAQPARVEQAAGEPTSFEAGASTLPETAAAAPTETTAAAAGTVSAPTETAPRPAATPDEPVDATGVDLVTVRRLWPDVLSAVAAMKRTTWSFISQNASVRDVTNDRLTLSFTTAGLRDVFLGRSDHQDFVREALIQVLGVDWKVDAIVDPSARPGPVPPVPAGTGGGARGPVGRGALSNRPDSTRGAQPASTPPQGAGAAEDAPSADDPDAEDSEVTHQDLLARELGAKVIGEYDAS